MVEIVAGVVVFGLAQVVSGVWWASSINTKVAANKTLIDEQMVALKELIIARMDETNRRLERIERGMNGHLPKD